MTNLKALALAGGALLAGAFTVPAFAQDSVGQAAGQAAGQAGQAAGQAGSNMSDTATGNPQHLRNIEVKVTGVDTASKTVTFQAQVATTAQIEQNGAAIKLDQLKAGDEVRASFDPKTGEVMKLQIEKSSGALAPSAPAPSP